MYLLIYHIVTVNSDMVIYSSCDMDFISECNQVISLYDDPFDTFQFNLDNIFLKGLIKNIFFDISYFDILYTIGS